MVIGFASNGKHFRNNRGGKGGEKKSHSFLFFFTLFFFLFLAPRGISLVCDSGVRKRIKKKIFRESCDLSKKHAVKYENVKNVVPGKFITLKR